MRNNFVVLRRITTIAAIAVASIVLGTKGTNAQTVKDRAAKIIKQQQRKANSVQYSAQMKEFRKTKHEYRDSLAELKESTATTLDRFLESYNPNGPARKLLNVSEGLINCYRAYSSEFDRLEAIYKQIIEDRPTNKNMKYNLYSKTAKVYDRVALKTDGDMNKIRFNLDNEFFYYNWVNDSLVRKAAANGSRF